MQSFSEFPKEKRKKLNLIQQQLSEKTGV